LARPDQSMRPELLEAARRRLVIAQDPFRRRGAGA
jgi:hypothetical protein